MGRLYIMTHRPVIVYALAIGVSRGRGSVEQKVERRGGDSELFPSDCGPVSSIDFGNSSGTYLSWLAPDVDERRP